MSTEREVTDLNANRTVKTTEEIKAESRAEHKAKLAQILDRGMVQDRLHVELPVDMYGEWVPDDPLEVHRMQLMGFVIDTEYAVKRGLHSVGGTEARIADVVFMVTQRETKELIDEIRAEQYEAAHGKKSGEIKKGQIEEKAFASSVDAGTGGVIPVIEESQERAAKKADIVAALGATQPAIK